MRFLIAILFSAVLTASAPAGQERPNILWIIVEDMSANFGCYGEKTIQTPNVDKLAANGIRFTNAIVTCPVCSPSRSALITGMYQTTIGAHQHRSGRGRLKISLPKEVQLVPELFQKAGYLTLNLTIQNFLRSEQAVRRNPKVPTAKTDYNFAWDARAYDKTHWAVRKEGKPFFAQIQLKGGKLRGTGITRQWPKKVKQDLGSTTPQEAVKLPPYLPGDPVILQDWAQYLDAVRYTDHEVGKIVERLKEAGELERTWIFFITDHGISHVRNKQFLYEGGVHIPLIISGPGQKPGVVREDPVEHIDLAATSLAKAGIEVPKWMQSKDIMASDYQPRKYVFAARDRCDETVERMRCVRTKRYKYIRNFYPDRPYLQPNAYKDNKPILKAMRRLHDVGKLNKAQSLIMRATRPKEELYDLEKDPYELHNLAMASDYQSTLKELSAQLEQWIKRTGDKGQKPETMAMYDSDMAVYLQAIQRRRPERAKEIQKNINQMKQWAKQRK